MLRLLLVSIGLFLSTSCKKDGGSESGGPAAIVAEGSNFVEVAIDSQLDQWVVLTFDHGLKGSIIEFPAGSLSASATVRIYMDYDLVGDDKLQQSFGLDDELVPVSRQPTILIEPAYGQDSDVNLVSSLYWTLPNLEESTNWSLLALIDNEEGRRDLAWLGQESRLESFDVKFQLSSFGSYQLVETAESPESSRFAKASSGSWWGYEIDLFNARVSPSEHTFPIWEFLIDHEGHDYSFLVDGQVVSPRPGLSFKVAETDHPLLYDGSDENALRPWIWSKRSLNGVMFTIAAEPFPTITARIMQRQLWPNLDLPSALESGDLVGSYSGQAVRYEEEGGLPFAELSSQRDALQVNVDESSLRLSGSLADHDDLEFLFSWPPSDPAARQLGVMRSSSGTEDMSLTLFVSLDRRALGYVLCESGGSSVCGDGDGGGAIDPFQLTYGILEYEP